MLSQPKKLITKQTPEINVKMMWYTLKIYKEYIE